MFSKPLFRETISHDGSSISAEVVRGLWSGKPLARLCTSDMFNTTDLRRVATQMLALADDMDDVPDEDEDAGEEPRRFIDNPTLDDIEVGDEVLVDEGFGCMEHAWRVVRSTDGSSEPSSLYVSCHHGCHSLIGQEDGPGKPLVGILRVDKNPSRPNF